MVSYEIIDTMLKNMTFTASEFSCDKDSGYVTGKFDEEKFENCKFKDFRIRLYTNKILTRYYSMDVFNGDDNIDSKKCELYNLVGFELITGDAGVKQRYDQYAKPLVDACLEVKRDRVDSARKDLDSMF